MLQLLDPNQSYTFSRIFDLKPGVDELVAELGYSLQRVPLDLPQYAGELDRLPHLRQRIEEIRPFVNLANEATRREVLISPVMMELVQGLSVQASL